MLNIQDAKRALNVTIFGLVPLWYRRQRLWRTGTLYKEWRSQGKSRYSTERRGFITTTYMLFLYKIMQRPTKPAVNINITPSLIMITRFCRFLEHITSHWASEPREQAFARSACNRWRRRLPARPCSGAKAPEISPFFSFDYLDELLVWKPLVFRHNLGSDRLRQTSFILAQKCLPFPRLVLFSLKSPNRRIRKFNSRNGMAEINKTHFG